LIEQTGGKSGHLSQNGVPLRRSIIKRQSKREDQRAERAERVKMMEKEDFDKDGFEAEIREKKRASEARRKERAEVRAAFPQAERDRKKWRKVGRGVREVRKVAEDDDSQEMNSDEEPAPQMIFVDGKFLIDVNSLGN
jgi:hypothetical protein